MNTKKLTLLVTTATDEIINEKTKETKVQVGGPAFYISKVVEKLLGSYESITHEAGKVTILVNSKGEFGKIDNQTPPIKVDFFNIKTPYLLISTVLKDFDLSNISNYKGFVFLDIQGYVRDGLDFGKKKNWNPSKETQEKIDCLVGTTEELSFLPKDFLENQKKKILLETKGIEGVSVYFKDNQHSITPELPINNLQDTIGAGDIFLANFACAYIKNQDVLSGINLAVIESAKFLQSKRQTLNIPKIS